MTPSGRRRPRIVATVDSRARVGSGGATLSALQGAHEHLSTAHRLLSDVAGDLPDLEQHAVRMLKGELDYALRRLKNTIHFVTLMGGPGARSDRVGSAPRGSDPRAQVVHQSSRSDRENREHSER